MAEFDPTPEQEPILGHEVDQHGRVLAGPGTGKSAVLVALIERLLEDVDRPRVRLLTFTRAATAELAKKVSEHPHAAAERPSTIHSFALSVLLRNPGAGGLPEPLRIADDWERKNVVLRSLADLLGIPVDRLDKLFTEMSANWECLGERKSPKISEAERARFLGAWDEYRHIFGYTLPEELPYALLRALRGHSDLPGLDYDLLVVDEYQDLNPCDLEVIRRIANRGCSIMGAGDDDQSIYNNLRHAAPEGIRRFPHDYPGAQDYPLSIAQRFGSSIVQWASFVIAGDIDRCAKDPLVSASDCPDGEVALLSFPSNVGESRGIGRLVHRLTEDEGLDPSDILILVRSNHNEAFSGPIKSELELRDIVCADPDKVSRVQAEPANRCLLAMFRLLVDRADSLAWASLFKLQTGIGPQFINYLYGLAREKGTTFGQTVLESYEDGFTDGPQGSSVRAIPLVSRVIRWVDEHPLPESADGWGSWMLQQTDETVPEPPEDLVTLLYDIDELAESDQRFERYLAGIGPLGKDLARAEHSGVRIMSMTSAKGLTVRATIIAGVEEGLVPHPYGDRAEERRLLYVAMTRARDFCYATWARHRQGPTARLGAARVGGHRTYSAFLDSGPVESQDGEAYIAERWVD